MGQFLVQRATALLDDRASKPSAQRSTPNDSGSLRRDGSRAIDPLLADAIQGLRDFLLLLRAHRLYSPTHPRLQESLDAAYDSLRRSAADLGGLDVRPERGGIVVGKVSDGHLPDARGEFHALAMELQRVGIQSLWFAPKFHVGELDTLVQLLKTTLLRSEESSRRNPTTAWADVLRENRVEGIQINTLTERKVDTVLASLIAALVAYGGNAPVENGDTPVQSPQLEEINDTLRLIGHLTPPMEGARGLSPEEAARAIHNCMEQASRGTVRMLLASMTHYAPQEGELPQIYLRRLSQSLVLEYMTSEFAAGSLAPVAVRAALYQLAGVLVDAGGYFGPHSSQHLSALATNWASDAYREQLIERFWLELPPREKSAVMRGPEIWCVPITAVRQTLSQLVETGADAPRREARSILLNYARRLEHPDACHAAHRCRGPGRTHPAARVLVAESASRRIEPRNADGAGQGTFAGNLRAAIGVPGNAGAHCRHARRFFWF